MFTSHDFPKVKVKCVKEGSSSFTLGKEYEFEIVNKTHMYQCEKSDTGFVSITEEL